MRFDIMPVATEKQITEVAEEAFQVWNNEYQAYYTKEQIDYFWRHYRSKEALKQQISNGYVHYMLLADNELAGFMCVLPQSSHMYLSYLYVKSQYRRQGLATKALSHLEGVLRHPEHGFSHIKKIRLKVKQTNHSAIAACEKMGFVRTGEERTEMGNGIICEDYVMERKV